MTTRQITKASAFVAGKRVPEVLAAIVDGSAPEGTAAALLARFETRAARKATKAKAQPKAKVTSKPKAA